MFSKLAIFAAATMAVFVAAAPQGINNSCNTGTIHCCNNVGTAQDTSLTHAATLLGLSLEGLTGVLAMNCGGIKLLGIGGGNSCTAQPVCCSGNKFNGLVNVGCTSLNINA